MYYDYSWKPCEPGTARFYSVVSKTDSGWLRQDYYINSMQLQMQALYEDSDCKIYNGNAAWYYANGIPSAIGRYSHNKQEGICVRYHPNGMIADSATYRDGKPEGIRLLWHRNGYMSDSIAHINDSTDVQVSWFDDGSLSAAGYLVNGKRHAKWKYYHRNENLAGSIVFDKGIVLSAEYFNVDGSSQPDTSKANMEAGFKNGGIDGWRKYIVKNTHWPHGLKLKNTTLVTVVISFVINEEGKPEDVEVYVPFHPEFDKAAEDIIRKSPVWKPAIAQNRKVKQVFRQPVTFLQEE
jgi:TonB family protein